MKKILFMAFAFAATFGLGFTLSTIISTKGDNNDKLKRVTGKGGIFFKCKDPKVMREWYQVHLGLNTGQYGAVFEWRQAADSTKKEYTQWTPFKELTKYFDPTTRDFMINYRVADLEALVEALKLEGVIIADKIETVEYGKFVHIIDVEGNKVELWEPNDVECEKLSVKMGSKTTK